MTTAKDKEDVPEKVAAAVVHEMHLDDFLNEVEKAEGKVESLAAYARVKRLANELKKTRDEWIKDFKKFEGQIPQ